MDIEKIKSYFKNKRVLITGHTGFKGSWLSAWLSMWEADVIGYSLDPYTDRDNFVVSGLHDKIFADIRADVRDYEKLKDVFDEYNPDIVFHLAAQPLVLFSYSNPKLTFETNIVGTVNVLEASRLTDSVRSIIIITSDKCYENKEWVWGYRENDSLGGYDPYSASKAAVETVVSSYNRSFLSNESIRKACATVRAGNVIGGGDWSKDRIIPDCIRFLERNEKIQVRNPLSIRPWQHLLEPLFGYILLAYMMNIDYEKFSGAWNFGPDHQSIKNVGEMVSLVIKEWGHGEWENVGNDTSDVSHETKALTLDISKAVFNLKWMPRLTIEESVKWTVDWYKNQEDFYGFTTNQIKSYEEKIKW